GSECRSDARRRVWGSHALSAGSLRARVAGVACIVSVFHRRRIGRGGESETARAEIVLPALPAIDPGRGWPGYEQAQAAASLFRFQKLYPLACLYSYSNRSRIVGLAN